MSLLQKIKSTLTSTPAVQSGTDYPLALDTMYTDNAKKLMSKYEKTHFKNLPLEEHFFRSDAMLKRCVVALASYATLTNGFDTVVEPPLPFSSEEEQKLFETRYAPLKAYCDSANKTVNMEDVTYSACIKLTLMGKAGYEIVREEKTQKLVRLIKLPVYNSTVDGLQPEIKSGVLKEFVLRVKTKNGVNQTEELRFKPSKVLYFVNNDVDGDLQGISDVQELIGTCIIRAALERESPQILKRVHDPYVISSVDTSNTTFSSTDPKGQKDELQRYLDELLDGIESGNDVVTNNKVTSQVMQLKIDLQGLIAYDDKSEDKIIAHFGIPRFLVNRPNVNRATADTEFKAFVSGTVAAKQRYIKRVLERDWYDMLTREFLQLNVDDPLPVRVKHVWRQSDVGEYKEKVDAAVALFGDGAGILGSSPELALQLSGLYNDKVAEHFAKQKELLTRITNNNNNSSSVVNDSKAR